MADFPCPWAITPTFNKSQCPPYRYFSSPESLNQELAVFFRYCYVLFHRPMLFQVRFDKFFIFFPKRQIHFYCLQNHFLLADKSYRHSSEITIIVCSGFTYKESRQFIHTLVFLLVHKLKVYSPYMNVSNNFAISVLLEIFAELVFVHGRVHIHVMDVIELFACRLKTCPVFKFFQCHCPFTFRVQHSAASAFFRIFGRCVISFTPQR